MKGGCLFLKRDISGFKNRKGSIYAANNSMYTSKKKFGKNATAVRLVKNLVFAFSIQCRNCEDWFCLTASCNMQRPFRSS